MIGYFALNPTSNNRLMRPEERICPFELRNGEVGAIQLLRLTDFCERSFLSVSKDLQQVLEMTLGFVKLSGVSNATIQITVAGMFRQKSEIVCGNTHVLLIRTTLVKCHGQRIGSYMIFNRCSQRYSVFYSDCFADANFDVIDDVFVRYQRKIWIS